MRRHPTRNPQHEPSQIMFFMVLVALVVAGVAAAVSVTIGRVAESARPAGETARNVETPAQADQTFYVLAHHWGFTIFSQEGSRLDTIIVPQGTTLEIYAVNAYADAAIEKLPAPVAEAMKTVPVPDSEAILATESEDPWTVTDHGFLIDYYGVVEYLAAGALEPTRVVFQANRPGEFEFVCTNYCGPGHIQMTPIKLGVQPVDPATAAPTPEKGPVDVPGLTPTPQEGEAAKQSQAALGQRIFTGDAGVTTVACSVCHNIGGNGAGPDLAGVAAMAPHRVTGLAARQYLEQAVLEPGAYLVEGWPAIMPSYQGQMTGEQLDALVDYLMTLE